MAKSKEEILKAYQNLKGELSKQPSYLEFYRLTKVTEYDIKMAFGSNGFNKLVEDAGDQPKKFSTEKTDLNSILENFGHLARELKKVPNTIDWTHHKMSPAPNNIGKYDLLTGLQKTLPAVSHGVFVSDQGDVFSLRKDGYNYDVYNFKDMKLKYTISAPKTLGYIGQSGYLSNGSVFLVNSHHGIDVLNYVP